MKYEEPSWLRLKPSQLKTLTQEDLDNYRVELVEINKRNRQRYENADNLYLKILQDLKKLFNDSAPPVKYMTRHKIPRPSSFETAYSNLVKRVKKAWKKEEEAKHQAEIRIKRLARQRAYAKSYNARKKIESKEQLDAAKLEGASDLFEIETTLYDYEMDNR